MYNVDIDTGGTMTDGLVSGDGSVIALKVETTPHDVTVAFTGILDAARARHGFGDLRSFLGQVEVIRWSSTITSNALAQHIGPKLGLLVTAGHEQDLYSKNGLAARVTGTLIDAGDISGIAPDADDAAVRQAVKALLDKGIRRITISLAGAFADNSRELAIVETLEADYPDHFLGSIPALAASEIVRRPDDATRTAAALINAYVHPALATSLYRAEEIVREEHGWRGNVLIGHVEGGVARIGKTKAFDTIESGPVFGTHACAAAAARYGDATVIAIDVGGTTAKASAVAGGRVVMKPTGDLFGIPLELDLPLLHSIALGGGSVARASVAGPTDGQVTLGPDSMGAAPGPACYGLGGRNATVTDAFVACGLVSPTAFLDGRRVLDIDKARAAIDKHVGAPLGLTTEAAARAIVDAAYDQVADLAAAAAREAGWDPAETTLYAYGGNGPLFITPVAERLGARNARMFRFGNVYSAYGSAISDVVHVYETAAGGMTRDTVLSRCADLAGEARRDLHGEGFDPAAAELSWEVRSAAGAEYGPDPAALLDARGAEPLLVRLTARFPLPTLDQPAVEKAADRGEEGSRTSPFGRDGAMPVREFAELPGTTSHGPLLVDGGTFTWLVTDGWSLSVDTRGDAALQAAAPQAAAPQASE
jgi:N-methylhydantoinase A/oxoprolinase/acetone carboxylase beta subunit